MPEILFQIGRATRTGTVEWTSPSVISALPNEEVVMTGNINPPQLTDSSLAIVWELYRSATPLNEASWLKLASGRWRGGPDSSQPSLGLPADIIAGFYLRGRAVITGTVNFGLTIETRAIT